MIEAQQDTPSSRAIQLVAETNRAAGAAERFTIGILTPLTDTGWTVPGETMVRGACLAADYVREHGGVCGGKQFEFAVENELQTADREPMWRSSVGAAAKLAIVDDVIAMLGQWHVRSTPYVVELTERLGVPQFVTTGHPVATRRQFHSVFRTYYSTSDRARVMVEFMKAQGARRIAVIAAVVGSNFGKVFGQAIAEMASVAPSSCEVLHIEYDQERTKDVRAELKRIKEWGPDFIVNLGLHIPTRMTAHDIVNQAAEIGLSPDVPMLVGISFHNAPANFWKRCGANGQYLILPTSQFRPGWPGLTPIGRWFVDRYSEKYGVFPAETALEAFTDVTIIAQALNRARSADRDGLIASLESGSFDSWRGPITFERGAEDWHHSPPKVQLIQYQEVEGEAVVVYPPELKTAEYATSVAAVPA